MAGSMVPPDIREQLNVRSSGGVGGAARENQETARQRQAAMGMEQPEEPDEEPEEPDERMLKVCPNTRCKTKLDDEWNYCSKCGQELGRPGFAAKKLGLEFNEKDVEDYIFRGYVVRDLPFLGKHKVTLKSSQASDMEAVDKFIMNGSWAKDEKGEERRMSEFFMRQMNALCVTATAALKLDGNGIGNDLETRVAYLRERGSAFVDLLSERVGLFNRALTDYLRKVDTVTGS
jgi:hypothetical protein